MDISHVTIGMESDNGYVNLIAAQHLRDAEEFSRRAGGIFEAALPDAPGTAAGRGGSLSTLWQVDDASAAALVSALYAELAAGSTPAEALRSAQLTVRRTRPEPYHWAGCGWSKVAADLESRRIGWFDRPRDERAWNTV
ncbi:CHAT domain-containing protein [Nocardia otitidiscaviarum]|uniref:CHAT domain-containing protein n=1 Tax=Nocardia otitidiscaviarum TaxID=1823 RepID=UPI0004A7425A|nr:CHAT domain-containing protein [Nocardia otitidiscaviarum]MBF6134709.1 CHAT domain-containing protein [Nocardia otitidiscaviarum]MBF6485665.1 CHAT domain-containing protein [Nocardia otitidiscaviarum]